MRDITLIESDLKASKIRYETLKAFLIDKPLMLESLNFILTSCNDKIKALESIIQSQQNELNLIDNELNKFEYFVNNNKTKGAIIAFGLEALYQKRKDNGKY